MAICKRCGGAKLTEQPCPKCGERNNQDVELLRGYFDDQYAKGERPVTPWWPNGRV
jgi:hypothetical protein